MEQVMLQDEHDMATAISAWFKNLYNYIDQKAVTASNVEQAKAYQDVLSHLENNFPLEIKYVANIHKDES